MSSRQQTREGREELRERLLQSCRSGALRPGDALPPLRELAQQHGLSLTTTQRVLQALADDGVLQLRQGAVDGKKLGACGHDRTPGMVTAG